MTPARRTREQWKALVEEQVASGKSQNAFVRENKLVLSSFQNWKKRLGKESGQSEDFVAVNASITRPVTNQSSGTGTLRIELANGIRIEVSAGAELEVIFRLLARL